MPPKKRSKRMDCSSDENKSETLEKSVKRKKKETNSGDLLCEDESDEFISLMVQTVNKLKDQESIRRLFSDEHLLKQKERSIIIVKQLKQVVDEFLVSVSQAEIFMESCDIQSINHDNYCLHRVDLPEIWAQIFSFLPIESFLRLRRVCKLWNEASELPEALVHYDYPIPPHQFSEKLFFEKYISFRASSIISYNGHWKGIKWFVKNYNLNVKKVKDSVPNKSGPNKDDTNVSCHIVEKSDTVFEKLECLDCSACPFIINTMTKAPSAMKHFPVLKSLRISSGGKRTKEFIISHPTLTSLYLKEFANVNIQCPILETCTLYGNLENLTINSKYLTKMVFIGNVMQLTLKEPTMTWDAQCLEKVTSVVKFVSPFVKSAYVGHECMIKYLPNLVSLILNGESLGFECLKKLPSSNQCLKEITFKNFKNTEELPKTLKKILEEVEHVVFGDCSSEFVSMIMESLSNPLRSVSLSKINLTKSVFDSFISSSFPNLHTFEINNLTKTHLKTFLHLEKMLQRMKSIDKLLLRAKSSMKIELDVPDHVTKLTLDSVDLVGSADGVKLLTTNTLPKCIYNNVEFVHFLDPFRDHLSLQKQMPSLKCIEWDSTSGIEFVTNF